MEKKKLYEIGDAFRALEDLLDEPIEVIVKKTINEDFLTNYVSSEDETDLDESAQEDRKELDYLWEKEKIAPLDKHEMHRLQELIQKYGRPEGMNENYYLCSIYGGYNCQELLADNIEVYAKDEKSAKDEAIKIYKEEYNYSEEDNPFGLEVKIVSSGTDDILDEELDEKLDDLKDKVRFIRDAEDIFAHKYGFYPSEEPDRPEAKKFFEENPDFYKDLNEERKPEENIKKWHKKYFPEEYQLDRINPNITFDELLNAMKEGKDVYDIISVDSEHTIDSEIRVKIFGEMQERYNIDVYKLWLYGFLPKAEEEKEKLTEAEVFDLMDKEDLVKAKDFNEEEPPIEEVIDVEASTISELNKKGYVGSIILQCPVCKTLFYLDPDKLEKIEDRDDIYASSDPESDLHIDKGCPHCGAEDEGFVIVGQVGAFKDESNEEVADEESEPEETNDEETEPKEITDEVKPEDDVEDNVEVKESLDESLNLSKFTVEIEEKSDIDTMNTLDDIAALNKCESYMEDDLIMHITGPDKKISDVRNQIISTLGDKVSVGEIEPDIPFYNIIDDTSFEDLDESNFDFLINSYLTEKYNDGRKYKTTEGFIDVDNNKIRLNGVITTKENDVINSEFLFEYKRLDKGSIKLNSLNEDSLGLLGKIKDKSLIVEVLNYTQALNESNSTRKRITNFSE